MVEGQAHLDHLRARNLRPTYIVSRRNCLARHRSSATTDRYTAIADTALVAAVALLPPLT